MPKSPQRRRRFTPPKAVIIAALLAFVLVDVALVGYALTRESGSTTAARPGVTITPSETPSPSPSTTVPPEPQALAAPTTYLSVVDSTTAYRVSAGSCPSESPAQLEKTIDGGSTWVTSPITTGVTSVLRLRATESAVAFVVGESGPECAPDFTATYTSGADFQTYPDRLAAAWYLQAGVGAAVNSPTGSFAPPCDTPVSLASTDDVSAGLICSDGTVFQTVDGAVSWDAGTQVEGARALTADTAGGFLIASVGDASGTCQGTELSSLDATGALSVLGCRDGLSPSGDTVLSAASGAIWLLDGDTVSISTDSGQTWS